jgi:hypothetical protein
MQRDERPMRIKDKANRLNDFQKNQTTKSLFKAFDDFVAVKGEKFGGVWGAFGPHTKQSKKGEERTYFLAMHGKDEYFANELLSLFGIRTPKTRISAECDSSKFTSLFQAQPLAEQQRQRFYMATIAIDDLMPIRAFRHELDCSSYQNNSAFLAIRKRYKLDVSKQTVFDCIEGKEYKISGNLFATHVAGVLIRDKDMQPHECNLNLIRINNRFYCVAIDKAPANFPGLTFNQIKKEFKNRYLRDPLYANTQLEQELAVLYRVYCALKPEENGMCDIDRIFLNKRVKATPELAQDAETKCANFKATAHSAIEHYKHIHGRKVFVEFGVREEIRKIIANRVIAKLTIPPQQLARTKENIIEDLRGCYYQHLMASNRSISPSDITNKELIAKISADISGELQLNVVYSPTIKLT